MSQNRCIRGGFARPRRGFTLVELLIAIAIMALLGTAAAALLGTALQNQDSLEDRQQALEQLALGLLIMRRDLEQLAPRTGRDIQGDLLPARIIAAQEETHSEVEFIRDGRRILPGQALSSSLERVRYEVEDGELIRYSVALADPTNNTAWQRQRLLGEVERFEMQFYDGERWTSFWPPSTQISAPLPLGAQLLLDTQRWPDLRMNVLLPEANQ